MTSPQPMTREELLELAALDAFGLLDEYDAALYTRSFHHAAATVQDEVKRLQAELVSDPTLVLVQEEPPAELRARVLAAVASAIEREEAQLAPLATIGRPRGGDQLVMPQRGRVVWSSMFWRAAAFVLATAVIALAYLWSGAVQKNATIAELALNHDAERDLFREYVGEGFTDFVKHARAGTGMARVLRPAHNDFAGNATIYFKDGEADARSAFVLALALPEGEYRIGVRINGEFQEQRAFTSNGVVNGVRIDRLTAAMTAQTWEIVNSAGMVVLTT